MSIESDRWVRAQGSGEKRTIPKRLLSKWLRWFFASQRLGVVFLPNWRTLHAATQKVGVYTDRASCRYRDHCRLNCAFIASRAVGPGGGASHPVPKQPQANRAGGTQLSRYQS